MTVGIVISAGYLAQSYRRVEVMGIKYARMALVGMTVLLFLTILGDNHVFEDSTLPQIIELHMTDRSRKQYSKSGRRSDAPVDYQTHDVSNLTNADIVNLPPAPVLPHEGN